MIRVAVGVGVSMVVGWVVAVDVAVGPGVLVGTKVANVGNP